MSLHREETPLRSIHAEHRLTGIAAAPGIAIGPAFLYRSNRFGKHRTQGTASTAENPDLSVSRTAAREIDRLKVAISTTDAALVAAEAQLMSDGCEQESNIFGAHRLLLTDPALRSRAITLIMEEGWQAAEAIFQAGEEQAALLEATIGAYSVTPLRDRANDIRTVVGHVWRILVQETPLADTLAMPSIIVADDIGPAELMTVPHERLLGLALSHGGYTAHAAILARAWGIPAVIGLGEALLQVVSTGMSLALDGVDGQLILSPEHTTLSHLRTTAKEIERQRDILRSQRNLASETQDGHPIVLLANVSSLPGARAAHDWGAAGIGSLRTELLFLGQQDLPNEEEQVGLYLSVAAELPNLPIIARTLDMGGDKQLPIFPLPREDNPFLGWRGIRIGLSRPKELLLPQLRAMLRAAAVADIRIVAPMISTLQEWRQLRSLLAQAHHELVQAGIPCIDTPQIGVLIETPSAALMVDDLAREADFISIGSNDLIQYTLACDRTNQRVAHLYQALEPAVLRLMQHIIEAAHRHGRSVSLCGEMASDPDVTSLLIGLGIDELSCTPPALPAVRAAVRATNAAAAHQMAKAVLAATSIDEVHALIRQL